MKPVSSRLLVSPECESSRLLVLPECFADRTKFFCGPHVCHPCFRSYLFNPKPQQVIQISKDSDCGLVSNKNFSEIVPSSGLGAGPGEVGQGSPKALHLWCHSQKTRTPQPKKFFWVQTTRLSESFELLTGSVALTKPEKFLRKATCDPAVFSRTAWINPGAKVLNSFSKCLN